MTTFFDPRAQRRMADALAEERRAEAEARRAATQLEMERARAALDAERRAEAEARREARRAARVARRARRREARRAAVAGLARGVRRHVPVVVGAVAMGAPIAIAWDGQLHFAQDVMHLGVLSPGLPVALEGSAWYLAYLTHRAIEQALPAVKYRVWTWVLAATAGGMNLWHGASTAKHHGLQVGAALGLTSLLGIGLWELTAGLSERSRSRRTAAEIRTALWRRLRYPRLSWAAASIAAARGPECTADEAWRAAWVDRYGVGPDATRRERRVARAILARQARADRKAARGGELMIADGAIVRTTERSQDTPAERSVSAHNGPEMSGGERSDSDQVSAQCDAIEAFAAHGIADLERWLADWSAPAGGVAELPPRERPDDAVSAHNGDQMSAQPDPDVSGGERSQDTPAERPVSAHNDAPVSGGERPVRPRRRRGVSARLAGRGERLEAVRRLLAARPDMTGAQIAAELGIPESTARRLRARALGER